MAVFWSSMVASEYRDSHYTYNLALAFKQVAEAHAEHIALHYPDGNQVTYKDLNVLSNRCAHFLLQNGVSLGDVVAIFNTKSAQAFAVMLACLKVGAIYVNLDVSSPATRLTRILNTCQPSLCFLDRGAEDKLELMATLGIRHFSLFDAEVESQLLKMPFEQPNCSRVITGADAAYIMFTSGSTGTPKGAVMSHGNVLNLIRWAQSTFDIQTSDRLTNVNPVYFDNSVFDFFAALFAGARMCPIPADVVRQPRELIKAINSLGCTMWFSVPSLLVYLLTMKAIGSGDFTRARTIAFGGEGFPKAKLKELYDLVGDRISLVNVYGPTECTCICSSHVITKEDVEDQSKLATLGRIAPNFGYRIDPNNPADPKVGELLLYGPNVGVGYFNDPERTRLAFVNDVTRTGFRSHYYRTGDIVREDEEGRLWFLGRVDNQIKHMGYRIELEEIEAAFAQIDTVNETAVVYRKYEDGTGKIVAFVAPRKTQGSNDILDEVREILPPYMIPNQVCYLDRLPKNRNGKVDRISLREQVT